MPLFRQIQSSDDLTLLASSHEDHFIDFKTTSTSAVEHEKAKDAAAFANYSGGIILVGAAEDRQTGRVGRLNPMTAKQAKDVRTAYQRSIDMFCSPRPVVHLHSFRATADDHGGFLTAVNVWPSLGQPIGVRSNTDSQTSARNGAGFHFPLRTGDHTTWLLPEQLPMFTDVKLRRTVLMIESIPNNQKEHVVIVGSNGQAKGCQFTTWDVFTNTCNFLSSGNPRFNFSIPLDAIRHIWRHADNAWWFSVEGILYDSRSSITFRYVAQ